MDNNKEGQIKKIENFALQLRKHILEMAVSAGSNSAHFGGALSITEIISTLFAYQMKIDKNERTVVGVNDFISDTETLSNLQKIDKEAGIMPDVIHLKYANAKEVAKQIEMKSQARTISFLLSLEVESNKFFKFINTFRLVIIF